MADDPDEQALLAKSGFEWPRYPRILVAVDETPASAFALRHVIPYAVEQRSQLTLLSVVPDPSRAVVAAGVSPQRLAEQMETHAETRLQRLAATLPRDLSVTTILRHGDPAEDITGALLGSVSTAVLQPSARHRAPPGTNRRGGRRVAGSRRPLPATDRAKQASARDRSALSEIVQRIGVGRRRGRQLPFHKSSSARDRIADPREARRSSNSTLWIAMIEVTAFLAMQKSACGRRRRPHHRIAWRVAQLPGIIRRDGRRHG